ncbi:polysaccharide biosynthesis/export family protein [Marinobacter salinisoli]|uniref:Polysaccharide biosynthesis/export family protein n=1 Tax=Marinobacter salinisoli TaxID=2769486 RepID=A0ABX7MSS4_9GAMM|nr:polysaccharide export protein [Marinobacter salinisoli]QSP94490.1 polysaccharide biosynthesis/export family protein [Marinobacter salinisoli]
MNRLLSLLIILSLSGCAVIPGAHIPYDRQKDESVDLDKMVNIYTITPQFLRENLSAPRTTPVLNRELEAELNQYDYEVNRGDVLNITVWDHPELTIPAGGDRSPSEAGNWVHSDGTIFYPYVGKVKVAGLKVTEIRDILRERLAEYIESPQVDVTVASFRSKRVYLTGEVKKPGTQPITNVPLTLLEAVSNANGLTEVADWTNVTLTRNGETRRYSLRGLYRQGDTRENVLLRPNDIIHVARNDAAKIFVLGEVAQQKSLNIGRSDITLAEALTDAGGFAQAVANANGVFVIRQASDNSDKIADVFQLHARNATALVLADQFRLQPRDIVYVTAAPIARWNRLIAQVLPTVQAVYYGSITERELTN